LEFFRLGTGARWFVVIGAIHGGTECNTSGVVKGLADRIIDNPLLLPQDASLFVLPLSNPDGCILKTRANANGIDLNRNWDTDDWIADAEGPFGVISGSGGPTPFSEPETLALRDWLLSLRNDPAHKGPVRLISYHSAVPPSGLTLPAYHDGIKPERLSKEMALIYSEETGYPYSSEWVGNYDITGELIHWAFDNQIVTIDVELPDRNPANTVPDGRSETHIDTALRGLLAIITEN